MDYVLALLIPMIGIPVLGVIGLLIYKRFKTK